MQRYSKVKKSGVEWVGAIPQHWSVKPLFALLRERQVSNDGNRESNVLSLSYGKIIRRDVESNFGLLPESFETYNIVEPDNIVLRLTDLQNDKRSLRCGFVVERGIITSAYLTLEKTRNVEVDPAYAYYLLHSYDIRKVFYGMGGGVRQVIKFADLKRLPVFLPPLEEQKCIVEYLRKKTSLIDDLIAKKKRIIRLIKEERAATINQAVTKGLDPKVELRNSGLPWLGKIPKHWEMKKLKYVGEAIIGLTYSPDEVSEEGTLVLRSSNVQNKAIVLDDNVYVTKQIRERLLLRNGDILICSRNGSRGLIGKCAVITASLVGNTFGAFMTVFRSKYNRFVYHIFNSTIFAFHVESFLTATINQLTSENLNSIVIPFPPPEEQADIAHFLEQSTLRIDSKIKKEERLVDLLREHRTALISEVVTGKIDVREI